jgi:hypothetical protein
MKTSATAMSFESAYDAMLENCNFPNLKRVVVKPKGASAEHDLTLTGDPTRDILALRAAKESGDKVIVHYVIRGETLHHVYNRPARVQKTSKRHDHAVKGALSWNNAKSYRVRYHEAKKSLQKLPLYKDVTGLNLGTFIAELHKNGVRRVMVGDDTILSASQIEKVAKYALGEVAPKKEESAAAPMLKHSDLDIVWFDDEKTTINKNRWVYFKVRGGFSTTFDKSTLDKVLAAAGGKLARFHSKECFVIYTPKDREPITREALQAILYTNPVVESTPPAEVAPVMPAAAPAALTQEQIAAIVAQAVSAALSAMQAK